MLRLGDRGAQPIWCAKELDVPSVMFERVLSRKIEVDSHSSLLEDKAFCVKLGKSDVDLFEGCLGDAVASDQVAKLQKSCKAADHLGRHMPTNRGQILLSNICYL